MICQARGAPPIHDITSDTVHPPQFVALAAARRDSPNGLAYGGAAVAEMQRRAYPDILPLALGVRPEAAFQRCLDAARGLGWKIVSADPAALRARIDGFLARPDIEFAGVTADDLAAAMDKALAAQAAAPLPLPHAAKPA